MNIEIKLDGHTHTFKCVHDAKVFLDGYNAGTLQQSISSLRQSIEQPSPSNSNLCVMLSQLGSNAWSSNNTTSTR